MLFNLTQTSMDSTSATAEKVTLYLNSSGVIREGVRADVEAPGAVWHLDLEPSRGFYPEWPVPLCVVAVVVCIAMAVLLFVALIASRENQKLVRCPSPPMNKPLEHKP